MKHKILEIAGWYGVLAVLAGYALVTFSVLHAKGYPYQFLNLTGAIGLVFEAASKKDRQPVVLNIVWALVAVIALVRLFIS